MGDFKSSLKIFILGASLGYGVVAVPAIRSFPGVAHLDHSYGFATHLEFNSFKDGERVALDVGLLVRSSEHHILLLSIVLQLEPETVSFCLIAVVTLTSHTNVFDRIIGQMSEDHAAAASLHGGVGSDELSPGLLHDHGPDLALVHGFGIDGALFFDPGAVVLLNPSLGHGDPVVDSDESFLATDVEPHGVSSSIIGMMSDEEIFERTRPRVELDHSGDEVAVSECALLG